LQHQDQIHADKLGVSNSKIKRGMGLHNGTEHRRSQWGPRGPWLPQKF